MSTVITPENRPNLQLAIRRELHYYSLYRILEAALLCLAVFSPFVLSQVEVPPSPLAQSVAISYFVAACTLFFLRNRGDVHDLVLLGIGTDILASAIAVYALPDITASIATMMLFNVGAAALLLPLRTGLAVAVIAGLSLLLLHLPAAQSGEPLLHFTAEMVMFCVSYLAIATLTGILGKQMRASEALAEQRGSQAANLAEINELIIRRMRTGVLLVDGEGNIKLANEAALLHLGHAGEGRRLLAQAAPELAARLQRWLLTQQSGSSPLQLSPELPQVLPRFARLLADDDQILIFLDDTELASRRAETLTLATLGRFSASLAHEIRNPLAAISYATQLLEESQEIPEADRRLLEIIYQQTRRMNGIIESVLSLARRERAQPEHVELCSLARQFVAEYQQNHPLEHDTLEVRTPSFPIQGLIDRQQLLQIMTVLVHNALIYGRKPNAPARVTLHVHRDEQHAPLLDILDSGPGIPEAVAQQLFHPFFTTSSHGTGLGLYIAREICLANQGDLLYIPLPAGGSCFRIRIAGVRTIQTS